MRYLGDVPALRDRELGARARGSDVRCSRGGTRELGPYRTRAAGGSDPNRAPAHRLDRTSLVLLGAAILIALLPAISDVAIGVSISSAGNVGIALALFASLILVREVREMIPARRGARSERGEPR